MIDGGSRRWRREGGRGEGGVVGLTADAHRRSGEGVAAVEDGRSSRMHLGSTPDEASDRRPGGLAAAPPLEINCR